MYVCMYVCMYVYRYVYMYIDILFIHTICVYVCIYVCVCLCTREVLEAAMEVPVTFRALHLFNTVAEAHVAGRDDRVFGRCLRFRELPKVLK